MADFAQEIAAEIERWRTDTSDKAAWDARALVDRASKAGEGDCAVEFGEQALQQWPDFEPVGAAVAWAFYRRDIANADPESATSEARKQAKDALARIRTLTSADPYGRYSAWPLAGLQVSRMALTRWPRVALDLLLQLDPDQLEAAATGDYPSNAGRWHLGVTKALEDLADWGELLPACDRALASDALRDEDRRWIRRRRAFALQHLGSIDDALTIFRELQRELPEWWIEADLAHALRATGDRVAAMDAARRAMEKPGKFASKWRTLMLLGELCIGEDEHLAKQHIQLARALRAEEGWPPDKALEGLATRAEITGPPVKPDMGDLRRSWRAAPDPARVAGVVKAVLPGGQSGFIVVDETRKDVYFAMPRDSNKAAPQPGTLVTFRLLDSFDKKKNRPSQRAIDVRPA